MKILSTRYKKLGERMKKILWPLGFILIPTAAYADCSLAGVTSSIITAFPSQTVGAITPTILRNNLVSDFTCVQSPLFSGPTLSTWIASLPTSVTSGGVWWNNSGIPTYSNGGLPSPQVLTQSLNTNDKTTASTEYVLTALAGYAPSAGANTWLALQTFTMGANITGSPSISVSPTGNATGGSILTTFASLNVQATTNNPLNREFLMTCGLTSNTGFGVANNNGDKVCLYTGAEAVAGSGDLWSRNALAHASVGVGAINVQGDEIDLNIDNQDYNNSAGSYSGPSAIGLTLSGFSAANKTATAAIQISSGGSAGGSFRIWNRGISLNGDVISTTGCAFCDYGNGHSESIRIGGHPTYGIYQDNTGVVNHFGGSVEIQQATSLTASGAILGIGALSGSNSPVIRFHSNSATNYDSRLIASGGGSDGTGNLAFDGALFQVNGVLGVSPMAGGGNRGVCTDNNGQFYPHAPGSC